MTTSHALEAKYEAEDKEIKEETESTNLEKLPNPTGWRLLVMPFAVKEKTCFVLDGYSTRLAKTVGSSSLYDVGAGEEQFSGALQNNYLGTSLLFCLPYLRNLPILAPPRYHRPMYSLIHRR